MKTCYGDMNIVIKDGRALFCKPGEQPPPPRDIVPAFDSKLEAEFARNLAMQMHVKAIKGVWHHPFALNLPGKKNRYTPDFLVEYDGGKLFIYEVKGRWVKNRREGIVKVKTAAGCFPCFTFMLVTKEHGRWVETPL